MSTRNVTLSLPEPLLQRFRVYAAQQNKSMTKIMTEVVEKLVDEGSDERDRATKRLIERMENAPQTGWDGKITWTRDEIHEW